LKQSPAHPICSAVLPRTDGRPGDAQQLERERARTDALQDRLANEQQGHAVTKNELKHAVLERCTANVAGLGGAFVGYGLSELKRRLPAGHLSGSAPRWLSSDACPHHAPMVEEDIMSNVT